MSSFELAIICPNLSPPLRFKAPVGSYRELPKLCGMHVLSNIKPYVETDCKEPTKGRASAVDRIGLYEPLWFVQGACKE